MLETIKDAILPLEGNKLYATIAVSVAAGLYAIRRFSAGPTCRSKASLEGKVVIVTGANTGIGLETARDLARRGGRVILACRDPSKGKAAEDDIRQSTGNNDVVYKHLDMASFKSIHRFAEEILEEEKSLDVLVNNAGLACPRKVTEDGFEMVFAVNYLGQFLLTHLLLDKLKQSAPSRIVTVASYSYTLGSIHFDDLQLEKDHGPYKAYCQSKLAQILFTRELSRRLKGTNVTINSLHPGAVRTSIARDLKILQYTIVKLLLNPIAYLILKSSYEGAQTVIYLAVSEKVEGVSGLYFEECSARQLKPHATDDEVGRKLWDISEELTGLKSIQDQH